jgi:hypothetical protein
VRRIAAIRPGEHVAAMPGGAAGATVAPGTAVCKARDPARVEQGIVVTFADVTHAVVGPRSESFAKAELALEDLPAANVC